MPPKEECETLLNSILPFAENLLKKYTEFYPVGAVMKTNDTISLSSAYEEDEFPDSRDVIDNLTNAHRLLAEKGEIKASAIAWNAAMATPDGKSTDAIIVSLEHKNSYSIIVAEPYKISFFKKVKFGELHALKGRHEIF